MNIAKVYLTTSSTQNGAMSVFHLYGPEEALRDDFDSRLVPMNDNPLSLNELRYGWLPGGDGRPLDEIMLGRPVSGLRVLTAHGGKAVREGMLRHFTQIGYIDGEILSTNEFDTFNAFDALNKDPLLASCLTEAQAAAVLSGVSDPALMTVHRVVLAGAPNAGKSSLLNALSGYNRAFVDSRAGATRDVVDELVDLGGYAVRVGDLPGFGGREDAILRNAWERAGKRLETAEWIWFVVDGSTGWDMAAETAAEAVAGALAGAKVLIVVNKCDLPSKLDGEPWRRHFPEAEAVRVSSLAGKGAYEIFSRMAGGMFGEDFGT